MGCARSLSGVLVSIARRKDMPQLGDKATCSMCGKEIVFLQNYWVHSVGSPRHPGVPDMDAVVSSLKKELETARLGAIESDRRANDANDALNRVLGKLRDAIGHRHFYLPGSPELVDEVIAQRDAAERLNAELTQKLVVERQRVEGLRATERQHIESLNLAYTQLTDLGEKYKALSDRYDGDAEEYQMARADNRYLEARVRWLERIKVAAEALLSKLKAIYSHPSYQAVWLIAQSHTGKQYDGPNTVGELERLDSALNFELLERERPTAENRAMNLLREFQFEWVRKVEALIAEQEK